MKLAVAIVATYLAILGVISPPTGAVCTTGNVLKDPPPVIRENRTAEPEPDPKELGEFTITAYSSTVGQTDDTPCIAADGTDVCRRWMLGETLCASNDYPFGARLYIGGSVMKTCTVADRMNARYTGKKYIDLYFGTDTGEAKRFGTRSKVPVSIDSPFETQP